MVHISMRISVTKAKGQLTDLVRQAEAGEEVILTRHGQPAAQIVAMKRKRLDPEERRRVIDEILASSPKPTRGPDAARSQDFLYDEDGLPK
jgi:prevent-host-death family protein